MKKFSVADMYGPIIVLDVNRYELVCRVLDFQHPIASNQSTEHP